MDDGIKKGTLRGDSFVPWVDIDPRKLPKKYLKKEPVVAKPMYVSAAFSHTNVTAAPPTKDSDVLFANIKRDKMMIVKVAIQPPLFFYQPMIIYVDDLKFEIIGAPEVFIGKNDSFERLYRLVEKEGLSSQHQTSQKYKAYLDGYVTKDGILRLFLNKLHPLPTWWHIL